MKKTNRFFIVLVFVVVTVLAVMLVGCNNKKGDGSTIYDMETRPFSMSISTPDGVFNPYFSSSAYDTTIVGMTQISMLSTDKNGNIVAGESEPCVTKDYSVTEGADTTTYEFLIKNGIKFSDGEPLTIKDVLFNLYVYLDPAYTGSATIYSTDIVGLKNYRQQQEGQTQDATSFEDTFVTQGSKRIETLKDYVRDHGKVNNSSERPGIDWTQYDEEQIKKDFAFTAKTFKEELVSDWNLASVASYEDWGFTEKWQVFLFSDGGVDILQHENPNDKTSKWKKDEKGNYILDEEAAAQKYEEYITVRIDDEVYAGMSEAEKIMNCCIDSVYENYFISDDIRMIKYSDFENIITYWVTATTVLKQFTAEAKSAHFAGAGSNKVVSNISGISYYPTDNFKGNALEGSHDVLRIVINDVDPKAIYNFAFIVAPMHYYSGTWNGKDYIAAFNGTTEFGLEFGSIDFMNNVINAPSKVGLPLGAGAYKASNASGTGTVTGSNFFNNNMIYYERNEYFNTVGKELSNAKIKYVCYKVVETDQIINALINGDIDFGDPSATQENIAAVVGSDKTPLGHVEIDTSGYGYVGINPRFVPNITVRRIIMKAMDTASITDNYYKGGLASLITRPMSKTSWAYPTTATTYVYDKGGANELSYEFDNNGEYIEDLLAKEGYKLENGVYTKDISGFGKDKLNYKFTIAGGSTDHPAYAMFLKAAGILNRHGFDVKVVTSQTALSDLSNGKLAVWAAAWSSSIDPDMYQVYHIDSQASSTSNWGYNQIKAGKGTDAYRDQYTIIKDLSTLIDKGRSTTDQEERKDTYAKALNKIMEFAVELPTYQRKDMSAYNKEVLNEETMTPESQRSPYNGLLARIWELSYR